MIKVLYFARLREQLGTASEQLEQAAGIETLNDLVDLLRGRGGEWEQAFAEGQRVMMALNQEISAADARVGDGDEVAFFPPVTGG